MTRRVDPLRHRCEIGRTLPISSCELFEEKITTRSVPENAAQAAKARPHQDLRGKMPARALLASTGLLGNAWESTTASACRFYVVGGTR